MYISCRGVVFPLLCPRTTLGGSDSADDTGWVVGGWKVGDRILFIKGNPNSPLRAPKNREFEVLKTKVLNTSIYFRSSETA
jgi:hypothetical protein